jgi:hypothetical protein
VHLRRHISPRSTRSTRVGVLARMRVGTKLTLLVVIPTCGLVVFASLSAIDHWREADRLREFRTDTRLSFAIAGVAEAVANERSAVVAGRLGVRADRRRIAAARRAVDRGCGELPRWRPASVRRSTSRAGCIPRAADSTRCAGRRRRIAGARLQGAR